MPLTVSSSNLTVLVFWHFTKTLLAVLIWRLQDFINTCLSAAHGTMGRGQKNFHLVWRCHQLLSGFLAKGHLTRVSRQSRRSLMIRVIMKWSWNCAQISWLLPYSRGNPQKTSARRPSDEGAVRPVIASNGVPFLQTRSVGSHSTSGREKEGKKEGMGLVDHLLTNSL